MRREKHRCQSAAHRSESFRWFGAAGVLTALVAGIEALRKPCQPELHPWWMRRTGSLSSAAPCGVSCSPSCFSGSRWGPLPFCGGGDDLRVVQLLTVPAGSAHTGSPRSKPAARRGRWMRRGAAGVSRDRKPGATAARAMHPWTSQAGAGSLETPLRMGNGCAIRANIGRILAVEPPIAISLSSSDGRLHRSAREPRRIWMTRRAGAPFSMAGFDQSLPQIRHTIRYPQPQNVKRRTELCSK